MPATTLSGSIIVKSSTLMVDLYGLAMIAELPAPRPLAYIVLAYSYRPNQSSIGLGTILSVGVRVSSVACDCS